jgi:creatinine amidohydrolase
MNSKSEDVSGWPLFLGKMTTSEVREAVKTVRIAILVVGSIEEHGDHLPIDTDLTTAEYLAVEGLQSARKATAHPVALIAPSIPYGGPALKMEWPGTVQLRPSVLVDVVCDIGIGLVGSGFRYVLILNGCVGNIPTLMLATGQLKQNRPDADFILVDSTWAAAEAIQEVRESESGGIGHAGELETSTSLVIDPTHVHIEKAVKEHYRHPSPSVSLDLNANPPFYWPVSFDNATESGVIGDGTLGTVEKGKKILEANVKRIADILRHIHEL